MSRQIPVVITSLDREQSLSGKYDTVVVNAHGCGVILPVPPKDRTPVSLELISNGRSKTVKIVLLISVAKDASWLVGLEFDSPGGNFWEIENPPADWEV